MKANELMIGDWVLTLDSTHKEKVFAQVDAIEEGQHSILVTRECSNWFVDIDWIEPIPLTSEILEKNGFVKQNFDGWEYIHPDDSTFSYIGYRILWRTDYDNHLFIKKYKGSGTFATLQISDINYVHQLQQALRFCRIEKEIVL